MKSMAWIVGSFVVAAAFANAQSGSSGMADFIRNMILRGAAVPKGEFETSARYSDRMDAILTSLPGEYAFVREPAGVDFTYSADDMEMRYRIKPDFASGVAASKFRDGTSSFVVASKLTAQGEYFAENSLGVRAKVDASEFEDSCIAFDPDSDINPGGVEGAFTMNADVARESKSKLRIRFVGHLSAGQVYQGTVRYPPTLDSPMDITVHKNYILVYVTAVEVIDISTGKILDKVKP